jgi:NAD(P)-dependent dehydrogenase (short-subunit alcohol dehydrogenase family)
VTAPRATYPDLAGKRVVVTGASQGIGLAIARGFAAAGSRVLAVARGAFPDDAREIETLRCDITAPQPLTDWLEQGARKGERVHVLVNNAGQLVSGDLIDATAEDFDRLFAVNTRATFLLSQLVARHMRAAGGGVIVNAGSFGATLASVRSGLYAASKAALLSLTRSMAAEWAPFGVRVNAFSPGVVPTRMTEPALAQHQDRMLDEISLRRLGSAEEVTAVVLFLASDASSYLTGVNIDVSGGKLIVQNPGAAWR